MNELGSYLRQRRNAAGLTLAEVASKAGIDKSYLSQIERGERTMERSDSRDTVVRIVKAVNGDPELALVMSGHELPREAREIAESAHAVERAILADRTLTGEQKSWLLAAVGYVRQADEAVSSRRAGGAGRG